MSTSGTTKKTGDAIIANHIETARRTIWIYELTAAVLWWLVVFSATLLLWSSFDRVIESGQTIRLLLWAAIVAGSAAWFWQRIVPLLRFSIHPEYAAQQLEQHTPSLRHSLLSYLTLRGDRNTPGLRGIMIQSTASHAVKQLPLPDQKPTLNQQRLVHRLAMIAAAIFILWTGYGLLSPQSAAHSVGRLLLPLSKIQPPTTVSISDVQPGTTQIVEGVTLEVSASIEGLDDSQEAWIEVDANSIVKRYLMIKQTEGTQYAGSLRGSGDGIRSDCTYKIVAGDATSETFAITVERVPVVSIDSVTYSPPAYTQLPKRTNSRGAIEGLEGTEIELSLRTNRPVTSGRIEFNPKEVDGKWLATAGFIPLTPTGDTRTLTAHWTLGQREQHNNKTIEEYRIIVEDSGGLKNPDPIVYPVRTQRDLAPEVAIIVPHQSPKDIPIHMEQLIEIHALDPDFGLASLELEVFKEKVLLGSKTIYDRSPALIGQQISISSFRPQQWDLKAGDVVTIQCRANDNRDLPGTAAKDPNSTVSDKVELRIIEAQDEESSQPDGDGLQPPREDSQGASGDSGDSGQQGGSGGSGSAAEQKEQDESQSGTGGTGSGESDQEQSETPKDSSNSGTSPSSDGDEPKGPQESQPNPGDQESESNNDNPQDPGDSEAESGTGTSDSAATDDNTAPTEGAPSEAAEGEGSAPPQDSESNAQDASNNPQQGTSSDRPSGSDDQEGPLHDGDIMERIKEHMDKQNQNPESTQDPAAQDNPTSNDENSGDQPSESPSSDATSDRSKGSSPPKDPSGGGEDSPKNEGSNEATNPEGSENSGSQKDSSNKQNSGTNSDPSKGESGTDPSQNESSSDTSSDNPSDSTANDSSDASEEGTSGDDTSESSTDTLNQNDPASDSESSDPGENTSAEQGTSETDPRTSQNNQGDHADPQKGASADNPSKDSASESSTSQSDSTNDPTEGSQSSSDPQKRAQASEASDGESNQSQGSESGFGSSEDVQLPSEEANLEYAQKATDLVLEYLKEQENQPDPELLDKLNWTEDDLRQFLQRWEQAKELGRTGSAEEKQDFQDQLKSLGIRPARSGGPRSRESQRDNIHGIRDSGSRIPAPALYRDAFEAFRRSVSQ